MDIEEFNLVLEELSDNMEDDEDEDEEDDEDEDVEIDDITGN